MVPGTGCSVVGRALQERLDGEFFPEYPVRENGRTVVERKHNSLPEILTHGLLSPEERDHYLVVATVRNPFDRWVTYYQRYVGDWLEGYEGVSQRSIKRDKKKFDLSEKEVDRRYKQLENRFEKLRRRRKILRLIGFNTWMKGTLLRWWWDDQQSDRGSIETFAFPMLDGVDVAMRQEALNDGLNVLLTALGTKERIELPRKNKTGGKEPYTEYYSWSTRKMAEVLLADVLRKLGYAFGGVDSRMLLPLSKRWREFSK